MKKIIIILSLTLCSFYASSQCNLFYDGFETGTFLPHWTLGPSNTQNVHTTAPAVGTYSLEHSGSSGHVGGSYATFTSGQPQYISYRIKSDGTTSAHGYVVIGDATVTANDCMFFSYVTGGNALRFYNNTGQNFPINANQWYQVEIQNINYTARTMDVYLDGNLILSNWAFRSTTLSSIDRLHIYNISAANAGYDEIIVGSAPVITNQNLTVCNGDSVIVASNTYYSTGNYSDTLIAGSSQGCDSIINTNLTVLTAKANTISNTICNEDSVIVNGTTYNAGNPTGTEVISNVGPFNCDSTVTINLNVLPVLTGSVTTTICNNGSVVVNGTTYNSGNPTGTEVFTNVGPNNCDSTVTVNLNVLPALTGSVTDVLCDGDSVVVNGTTYNASNLTGTEVFTNVGPNNCDSTVTVNISVLAAKTGTVTTTICDGDSVVVNGTTYNSGNPTGTEIFTNVGPNNCDSTVTINLTVNPLPSVAIASFSPDTVCETDPAINLPVGTPASGTYSGNGVVGTTFDPNTAGVGVHYVVYSFTDSNSCANMDSTMIVVESCVGIDENGTLSGINIYPNPTNSIINITLGNISSDVNLTLTSVEGKIVYQENNVSDNKVSVDMSSNSKGIYFLKVEANNQYKVYKVVKE